MRHLLAAASVFALGLATTAHADEGMWTFDNFPIAKVNRTLGTHIDQAWLDHVRGAAVRLSTGCSASVVTGEGLVLTNHHCVRDCAQDLSTAQTDYIKDGFSAARREEERLCPGMQAEILTSISDVTPKVLAAGAGKTGLDFVKATDAVASEIEKSACAGKEAQYRCQVINLYQGGQYKLYTYRKYSDVRLVFAPEEQMAFFGGDPDNFNFPRYDIDFSFVRLYENGKPVATPEHLVWNPAPPRAGEPVFVAGNPGSTDRLLTADQLETLRDLSLPETLIQYSELRGRLIRFGEESPEHRRTAETRLFGIENSFKALHGEEQTLADPPFIEAKRRADAQLRARVLANPRLKAEIGDPWAEVAKTQADQAALYLPYTFTESRAGYGSRLFSYARTIVRGAVERAKPAGDRLPEFAESRLPLVQKNLLDDKPVYRDLEQLQLEFWLTKLRENLTADAPEMRTFLGKDSPEQLSERLAASRLGDAAVRRQLWEGGLKAVQASDDPMIRYVLATDPAAREIRRQWEARVVGPTSRAEQRIAKARFAVFGSNTYPDATFSLRLSYGKVAGWTYRGQTAPPFTYFKGLYERATGQYPFELAPKWVAAQSKLNPNTVFDISTDNDIIGGNSGSPLINAQGQVIGAIFDGNIHSLGGAYAFDPAVNRSVAVSTAAITEALDKVWGNRALVAELTSK